MKITPSVNIYQSDEPAREIKMTFLNNNLSKKGKESENRNRKKYLCHYRIIADVFNVQKPGNMVTIFTAIVACLLDLVN